MHQLQEYIFKENQGRLSYYYPHSIHWRIDKWKEDCILQLFSPCKGIHEENHVTSATSYCLHLMNEWEDNGLILSPWERREIYLTNQTQISVFWSSPAMSIIQMQRNTIHKRQRTTTDHILISTNTPLCLQGAGSTIFLRLSVYSLMSSAV